MTHESNPTPESQSGRFAWSAERNPDWWLDSIADAIRRANHRVRQGYPPEPEWDRLYERTLSLTQLTERKEISCQSPPD